MILPFLLGLFLAAPDDRPEGWVVLPIEEYKALREKAEPLEALPSPPPYEATLSKVDYDLKVLGDQARGEARLTVDVFKDGWVRVPIPVGLKVREARLDGKPVSIVENPSKGPAAPAVLLSKPGRAVLSLDVAVPIASSSGTESLTLPRSGAALSRVALSLPRSGIEVALSGGLLSERAEGGGQSRFVAFGRAGEPLTFSWRRKLDDRRSSQPLRMRGSVTAFVGLGEETAQLSAEVQLEVLQGQATEVQVDLPKDFAVNEVSGPLVADWEAREGALRVSFLEPVERDASLTVAGEVRCPREGLVDVPILRLRKVERETGGVAVEVVGEGEVKGRKAEGLEEADPSDLSESVARRATPSTVAFRLRPLDGGKPRALALEVSRYTPQAVLVANVEEARFRVLLTEEGKTLVEATWAVRNNQRAFLKAVLPDGAALWSASVGGRPVRPGVAPDGGLLLPLEKGRAGEEAPAFLVQAVYFERGAAWERSGRTSLKLPGVDLPVSRTGLELRVPPRYAIKAEPGAFREGPFEAPVSAAFQAPPQQAAGKAEKDEFQTLSGDVEVKEMQKLVERYQRERMGARATGVLPLDVLVPSFGPMRFLAGELTAEGQSPVIDLTFKREGK